MNRMGANVRSSMAACGMPRIEETPITAPYDDAADRVAHSGRQVRLVGSRPGSLRPGLKRRSRSTHRKNENGPGAAVKASRAPWLSGFLDRDGMNGAADLNLVPLTNLPRRAKHKNERTCRSWASSDARS